MCQTDGTSKSAQINSGATNGYLKDKRAAIKSFKPVRNLPRYPALTGSDGGCGKMNERRTDDHKVQKTST